MANTKNGIEEITEHFRFPDVIVAGQVVPIEFDGFIEEYKMAIEIQGIQHYFDTFIYGSYVKFASQDEQKAFFAANRQITLMEIPWWCPHESSHNLLQTVKFIRPELKLTK